MEAATDRTSATAPDAWDTLGTGSALLLEGAALVRVELPFLAPVGTAVGTHRVRSLLLVHLRCRVPGTDVRVDGWGESAALGDTTYDAEDVDGARDTLGGVLLPGLGHTAGSLGRLLPSLGALKRLAEAVPDRPLAYAALEAAVADAHLQHGGVFVRRAARGGRRRGHARRGGGHLRVDRRPRRRGGRPGGRGLRG